MREGPAWELQSHRINRSQSCRGAVDRQLAVMMTNGNRHDGLLRGHSAASWAAVRILEDISKLPTRFTMDTGKSGDDVGRRRAMIPWRNYLILLANKEPLFGWSQISLDTKMAVFQMR